METIQRPGFVLGYSSCSESLSRFSQKPTKYMRRDNTNEFLHTSCMYELLIPLSLSLSLSHTHTHTHTHSLSLSLHTWAWEAPTSSAGGERERQIPPC